MARPAFSRRMLSVVASRHVGPSSAAHVRPLPRAPLRSFSSTAPTLAGLLQNHDIPFTSVQLVDQETKSLLPPQSLVSVLRTINFETHAVRLVNDSPPTVRIFDLLEEKAAQRQKEAAAIARKATEGKEKEVQVSWNSADGDLASKMKIARQIMTYGDRVKLVFAPRVGGKKVKIDPERIEEIIEMFDDGLVDIGSKYKEDDIKGRTRSTFWQPNADIKQTAVKEITKNVGSQKEDKLRRKEERSKRDREKRLALEAKKREEGPPPPVQYG